MSDSSKSELQDLKSCPCTDLSSTSESLPSPHCECPRDEHEIVIHEETCLLYKNETIIFPHEPETCECQDPPFEDGVCRCCGCSEDQCHCKKAGREIFDQWRAARDVGAMPSVLEVTHPLMQRFQETLKRFLIRENEIAEEELLNLRYELKQNKEAYDRDLETIYQNDHDTNAQRILIQEYENSLAQRTAERVEADKIAKETSERHKRAKEKLEQDLLNEREAMQEVEALTTLCKQLEKWRDETDSDLTVSHNMSDKMKKEKQALAEEKRDLDMIIFSLNNEIWKLESKMEMFQKQLQIKNAEMDKVNDKVTAYAAELDELDLDKRRLMNLWNSVIVNIQQRDRVFESVRDDYTNLQENYRTLLINLEITKKIAQEEINVGKDAEMTKDKLVYETERANKHYDMEDQKRIKLETQIAELTEAIELTERDQQLVEMETQTMRNILKSTQTELDKQNGIKLKLENEILANIQECLLNDKAVEAMANGIKKMREMARKQEISLGTIENQHAKVMLEIEIYRNRQIRNNMILEESLAKVKEKEKEVKQLEDKFEERVMLQTRKQRELDIILKKHTALKEICNLGSPQEARIAELEQQIKTMRERTDEMQHEWLRLQGHVVKLTEQLNKVVNDINLINKQIQICEQKTMRVQGELENVVQERMKVDRVLRDLRGKLEVLERTRKDSIEKNDCAHRTNVTITQEYSANLKEEEMEIIQLEEEIEAMEKEKNNLTQELDRVTREALIWQRKGIQAVELKKNMKQAQSSVGEISQMKSEIHRMEVRSSHLRRTAEKLSEDMAQYVTRRETLMDKSRAAAAVEKSHGGQISQSTYHHKLRLARADVARVTKDLSDAEARLKQLQEEQERLDREVSDTAALNAQLEEQVAALIRETRETDRQKQWLLERVVRSQRLSTELANAVKRQSLKVKKPKASVLAEYSQAFTLNNKLKYIVECLRKEYPHLSDRLDIVENTLNIVSPSASPRLTEVAEKPYCQQ